MKRFIRWQVLLTYLLIITALGTTAYYPPKVFAANDFTATNVTFDPTTGYLEFDYTGANITSSTPSMRIVNSTNSNTQYWLVIGDSQDRGDCTSSHCWAVLAPRLSDSGVTTVKIDQSGLVSQDLTYPLPLSTTYSSQNPSNSAWLPAVGGTLTYASSDAPTYTATASGDLTGVYTPGMRIKLTQSSTLKYFLLTGASYSSGTTTFTLYGGTDFSLANATISNVYFSAQKAPVGFPLNPAKWTERLTSTNDSLQSSPSTGTWYNNDTALNLSVPIGAWKLKYVVHLYYSNTPGSSYVFNVTASSANNSQTDADLTSTYESNIAQTGRTIMSKEREIVLTSKTTYYINSSLNYGSVSSLGLAGDRNSVNIIEAVSSYL